MATAVTLELAADVDTTAEEVIRLRTREVRHARMRFLAEQAMADPEFVSDMQGTMQAFQHSDKENWPAYAGRIAKTQPVNA